MVRTGWKVRTGLMPIAPPSSSADHAFRGRDPIYNWLRAHYQARPPRTNKIEAFQAYLRERVTAYPELTAQAARVARQPVQLGDDQHSPAGTTGS